MFLSNFPYCFKRSWHTHLRFSLVALLVMAVIDVGCYVWINNSVAVITDNEPTTMVLLELYDGFDHSP